MAEGRRLRVLVSGFDPFGGEVSNPTADLVRALAEGHISVPANVEIHSAVLPVGFHRAFETLKAHVDAFQPQVILAFGQAGGRSRIEFERIAVNLMDAEIPDNFGQQPTDVPITEGAPNALFSTLPLKTLVQALQTNGLPAGISNSAGLYVCNYLFFRLQSYLLAQPKVLSGFIHVPYSSEQAERKNAPSISFIDLKRSLEVVLLEISKITFSDT